MKKALLYVTLMVLISSLVASCTSGNRIGGKGCGCEAKRGYVGY